ncbi:hypothetical protein BDA99DRAFT_537480 [Phascolomyces articulosus]|uniref:F-box domain-containing protein n=1 Tax=Phascolomyces articulosus TaxID=60185 RepID=A0AAD5KCK5_9FUNG|nr:hypothetical protein BDA99DRAFT_537480 [Phascolomyces articulosus]
MEESDQEELEKYFKYNVDPSTIFDQLKDSFIQAEQAFDEGSYHTAVARSTKGLDILMAIKNKLLYIRMKTRQHQNEIHKACGDAESLETINESDIRKPVYLAHLLMKDERMPDVIDTCNTVLKNQNNVILYKNGLLSKDGYEKLMTLKGKAIEKSDQRVDLMKRLPRELTTLILNQLDLNDILHCMHVARHWQKKIIHCPIAILRNIIFPNQTKICVKIPSTLMYTYLQQLSDRIIRNLTIAPMYSSIYDLFNFLENVKFYHLRSLTINMDIRRKQVTTLLKTNSNILEEVYLYNNYSVPPLNEVLDICPNLKLLCYCGSLLQDEPSWDHEYHPQRQQQTYPSLISLQLYTYTFRTEDIKHLLEFAVNLKDFTITDYELNSDTLKTIRQYGKHLHHICIDSTTFASNPLDHDDDYLPMDIVRYKCSIDVQDCYEEMTGPFVLSMLNNMEYKPEALALSVLDDYIDNSQKWGPLANVTLPNLRYLKVSFTRETEQIFTDMILQCPTLEEIILYRLGCPPNIILHAVKSLPRLQSFAVENTYKEASDADICTTKINDKAIRHFFLHHVALGDASTLEHVRLRYISEFEPETFKVLVKIKHLKTLHLAGSHLIHHPDHTMGSVMKDMGKAFIPPELEMLVLEMMLHTLTDGDLKGLDCPTITLHTLEDVTLDGIRKMIESAQKLKGLVIHDWKGLYESDLMDLAKKENIHLSVTHQFL